MNISFLKYYCFYFTILSNSLFSMASCIVENNRDIVRNNYTFPEQIQSEHFVIHFTVSDADSQFVNGQMISLQSNFSFAQSIIDLAEIAYDKYMQKGWIAPPPDCDESILDINSENHCINFGGNSLYDIYISNDGVGMVVPETPYNVPPYTGGYTTFMKVSTMQNAHTTLPSWATHVVAHELHHSIQLRYGYSTSGEPGNYMHNAWFFEQSATYMENMIFPNANHLQLMLNNCSVVTPLTYPNYSIDYPSSIYPYRSALWQKFLVESLGDSSIIRLLWEDYGTRYATGDPVSLFPIYSDAINSVTNNEISLSDSYKEYALWRYFTGDRSINGEYFNEANNYCTSTIESDYEGDFEIVSNKGGAYFFELPLELLNLKFTTSSPSMLNLIHLVENENGIEAYNLDLQDEITILSLDGGGININSHVLVVTPSYDNASHLVLNFSIELDDSPVLGDVNFDSEINVLDVVAIINFSLLIDSPNELEFEASDINNDNFINILDVVQLINIILV